MADYYEDIDEDYEDDCPYNPDDSCWWNGGLVRMAAISVLLVAVPIMIILIGVYIGFHYKWGKSEKCLNLCKSLDDAVVAQRDLYPHDFQAHIPPVQNVEDPPGFRRVHDRRKREVVTYPPIGALLENLYQDETDEQIVKCPVVLVSKNWLLTSSDCMDPMIQSISVRINSNYWSRGGVIKKIYKIFSFEHLLALQLRDDDSSKVNLTPIKLCRDLGGRTARGFNWGVNLNQVLKKRSKFRKLEQFRVKLDNPGIPDVNSPLVDPQKSCLLGFLQKNGQIVRVASEKYRKWLNHVCSI